MTSRQVIAATRCALLAGLAAYLGIIGIGCKQVSKMSDPSENASSSRAVIVYFDYGNRDWSPFFDFEETLELSVARSGLGDYDGNELAVDGSDGSMYLYGPSAEKLFDFIRPSIEKSTLLKNVRVILCYGEISDPKARQKELRLGADGKWR